MKSYKYILTSLLLVSLFFSCKKDNVLTDLASVNIINATVNVSAAKVNYLGTADYWKNLNDKVSFGASKVYTLPANTLRQLSIASSTDTTVLLYNRKVKLNPGDIYSLYMAGQSTAVDTIFVKETNIPNRADSTTTIRFINLSYNSAPVNVTLSTTPTVNEFTGVAYKSITDFKIYPVLKANTTMTFQVMDAANNLLTSYSFTDKNPVNPIPRFHSCTLALKGMVGGTGANALGIMRVNNY